MTRKLSIKKGREWQILRGHPWLFSGSISQAPAQVEPGSIVDLVDCDGEFIARGYYNAECDIAVRVLSLDKDEEIDVDFLDRRIKTALQLRRQLFDGTKTNMFRLVNAEGDFLPGFIVDAFDDLLVVQSHTAGSDKLLQQLLTALVNELKPKCIVARNDSTVRRREGLKLEPPRVVYGHNAFPTPDTTMNGLENGLTFSIDPLKGQKTGFFTDQRDKRVAVAKYAAMLPGDATLANCFSYSAAFSVYAVKANPQLKTLNIDESHAALELGRKNFDLNGLDNSTHEFIEADVFDFLDAAVKEKRQFDFVILDPPAFAKKQKDHKNAMKAYTRLNKLGIKSCAPGAFLMTCSCSGVITMEDLEDCLRAASAETGRPVQILEIFKHGADHPINLAIPETEYLKVLLGRVL